MIANFSNFSFLECWRDFAKFLWQGNRHLSFLSTTLCLEICVWYIILVATIPKEVCISKKEQLFWIMLYARSPIFSQVPRWPIHPFTRCDGLLLPSEYEIVLLPALSRYSKTTQYFRAMAIPSTEKPSCRTDQFQLLSQYIPGPGYPLPEALVAQGLQGTGVIKHLVGFYSGEKCF